jgi:predicted Zn-dependent peptidase
MSRLIPRLVVAGALAVCSSVVVTQLAACTTAGAASSNHRKPPDEPWRSTRPAPGPAPELKLPVFQKVELKNGLTLFVVEQHDLPTVDAAVVVRAGAAQETAREAGLARLTWDLLDEGAGTMNSLALANAFGDLGTRIDTSSGPENGFAHVAILKKNLEPGLEVLATVVRKPTFAQADFDRVRANLVGELKAQEGEPSAIAGALAQSLVFGADHPYGHDDRGTVTTLEKLTAARVKKFWSDNAGPKNAALILIGDITVDEARALGEKHFGKWTGGPKAPKPPADPKARAALKVAFVDVPGAPQTSIRVGRAVMSRGDPDEASLIVFNEIVGGQFSSRLNMKLREEKGWTYGCYTSADRRLGKGPWGVSMCDVQTPNTADAVAEILAQFDAMKASGATDDEIARAKDGTVKSFPSYFATPVAQLMSAATLFTDNLAPDYYNKLVEAVNAVNGDAIKKMAERVLVKEDMVLVLVGDRATVEPGLREKGITDVVFFNRDGTEAK